jgi:hypothetical protein
MNMGVYGTSFEDFGLVFVLIQLKMISQMRGNSQTRPRDFMHHQEEYPHLHTSDWIQLSHCLHIAFALEKEKSGD